VKGRRFQKIYMVYDCICSELAALFRQNRLLAFEKMKLGMAASAGGLPALDFAEIGYLLMMVGVLLERVCGSE